MAMTKDLTRDSLWQSDAPALAVIVLLGGLLYAHTLHVPWYFDDYSAILANPSLHSFRATFADFFSSPRGLIDVTFALNYWLGKTDVAGYHLTNIFIHLLASCLVFLLLKRIFPGRRLLALGGALIFVAHPLQTQAVTYIVQRATSLAACLFFLALYSYVRAREFPVNPGQSRRILHPGWYLLALLAGALAVVTKQNTAVLPFALLVFERYFLPRDRCRTWTMLLWLAPFCVIPAWQGAKSLILPLLTDGGVGNVAAVQNLAHLKNLSPLSYLFTEFSVIWLYIRLLFLPFGQMLDYYFPLAGSIWNWKTGLSLLGICSLLAVAAGLRHRNAPASAGILLFFLGLAVESTIIPLDPVFEHRLYLPMFGFVMVAMSVVALFSHRFLIAVIVSLSVVLGILTWQRNALWNDPEALLQDNLRRAPRNERIYLGLANVYLEQGRLDEARSLLEQALSINPDYVLLYVNLSKIYAAQQQPRKAEAILLEGLHRGETNFMLYYNLGVLYNSLGNFREAIPCLQKSIALEPENAKIYFHLGWAFAELDQLDAASANYRRSLELDAADDMSHFNLGLVLYRHGDRQAALQEFLIAGQLRPDNLEAHYNAALVYAESGELQMARDIAKRIQRIDPALSRQLLEIVNK